MLLGTLLKAQADYDLTQRWFNEALYNPAAAGNNATTGVFLHARAQWLGLDGAPMTQGMTFDTYAEEINSAFGAVLLRDQTGYLTSYTVKALYAYYVSLGNGGTVAFGISGGLFNRNKTITADMAEQYDPALAGKTESHYAPEFEVGAEYKGLFKAGVSMRHLGFAGSAEFPTPPISVWAYASSRFNMTATLSIEPLLSYMFHDGISRYEAGALFYFMKTDERWNHNDRFWIGAVYRPHGEVGVMAGMHVTAKMRVGYSFDYGTGALAHVSKYGTHELFVSWHFNRIFYKDTCCPAYER